MNFLNKIFASSHNRGSFQIEDVSGSEDDQDEIPEHQEIPQFKKQSIQQLSSYNSRKKPQPKIGQADFLARYDENFDDVFGDKPTPIDFPKSRKRRQEEEEDDENENERKPQKKKTQSKERRQQPKEQKDNKKATNNKEFKETIDNREFNDNKEQKEYLELLEPKIQKEPKIRLPKQRKRMVNNHLSTLRSNSDNRESLSNKDRESIQQNNKYNPNDIALPQTAIPKSEKKQDKQKTMFFSFGIKDDDDDDNNDNNNDNDDNNNSEKEIKNQINNLFFDQKEKQKQNNQQSYNNQKKQKNEERKDRNEKKQRKEKKDKEKEKQTINHLNLLEEIKDLQKNNGNSKQNSEQRETRKMNSEQREKKRDKKRESKQSRYKNEKLTSKSPSPQVKLIQYETQKRVKRSSKRIVQDLEMLNVDELSLNPNIVECKPNLYLDYIPVYD